MSFGLTDKGGVNGELAGLGAHFGVGAQFGNALTEHESGKVGVNRSAHSNGDVNGPGVGQCETQFALMDGKEPAAEHTDTDGNHGAFHAFGKQMGNAGAETHDVAVAGDGAFGEDTDHLAFGKAVADIFKEFCHCLGVAGAGNADDAQQLENKAGRQKIHDTCVDHKTDPAGRDRLNKHHIDH